MSSVPSSVPAVVMRRIETLVPYIRNPRKNDGVVDQMCSSIREFGFKVPVLAKSDGTIVDGHLRLKAAQKLKLAEIPVILCDEWSEAQIKAFRLLANRSVNWAEWDNDLLKLEFEDLKGLDFDLSMTGFDVSEIDDILNPGGTAGNTDENTVPDVPEAPVSAPGDIWLLGPHRLICGDSTVAGDVSRLLNGVQPGLMVTDPPPYGVSYDPHWRNEHDMGGTGKWAGASRATGKVNNDDRADWKATYALFPGNIAYVWHGGLHAAVVAQNLEECGFKLRAQIIWRKQHFVFSRGDYHWQHEPCWYAVKKTGHWTGDRKQTTIWDIQNMNPMGGTKDEKPTGHGTQKPVECMRRPILNHTDVGQSVYEPFSGSGTTIIACQTTSRVCFAVEINTAYVDLAINRWEAFTGHQATLDGSGKTFAEITAERRQVKTAEPAPLA